MDLYTPCLSSKPHALVHNGGYLYASNLRSYLQIGDYGIELRCNRAFGFTLRSRRTDVHSSLNLYPDIGADWDAPLSVSYGKARSPPRCVDRWT